MACGRFFTTTVWYMRPFHIQHLIRNIAICKCILRLNGVLEISKNFIHNLIKKKKNIFFWKRDRNFTSHWVWSYFNFVKSLRYSLIEKITETFFEIEIDVPAQVKNVRNRKMSMNYVTAMWKKTFYYWLKKKKN